MENFKKQIQEISKPTPVKDTVIEDNKSILYRFEDQIPTKQILTESEIEEFKDYMESITDPKQLPIFIEKAKTAGYGELASHGEELLKILESKIACREYLDREKDFGEIKTFIENMKSTPGYEDIVDYAEGKLKEIALHA